jgi:drug/metabolite transporter (DMT)-like permease
MIYILTAITALLLVSGQSLWKMAANNLDKSSPLIHSLSKVLLTPQFIVGAFLYALATLIYLWLFSKYNYSVVQLSLIAFSVILSSLIAVLFFKEHFSIINVVGVFVLIAGIMLVTWKS